MMRNIIYRVKSLISHEAYDMKVFNRKILDDIPSSYGLVRNSPQLRLMLREYKKENQEVVSITSDYKNNESLCEL
jgi:hypothetical protein